MKKFLVLIVFALFALPSCHKNSGCLQPFTQEEIPELTANGYNTCEAIIKNYSYRICDGDLSNYPYWPHEGDTIKVCGYIHEAQWIWLFDGSPFFPLYDGEPYNHDLSIHGRLPDTIDYNKKCYIEGVLYFNPLYSSGSYPVEPVVKPINEIRFEEKKYEKN